MEADDPAGIARALEVLFANLGPMTVVMLVLVGMVGWLAWQFIKATRGAAPAAPERTDDARALGRVEGLIEGHAERLDAIEDRLRALETKRTRG